MTARDARMQLTGSSVTRRNFLRTSAMGLTVVTSGGLLSACGGDGDNTPSSSPSGSGGGTPKRGGTLRVGSSGGASSDTLDPQAWATLPDQLRANQLYDPLVWQRNDSAPELVMAEEIEPNADGTEWTITIPKGIKTHQGKPFTAEDVLFSLQRMVDNKFPGASVIGPVDIKGSKAINPTTVKLAFSQPFGYLVEALSFPFCFMVPRGFDPKKPDGTGPFKLKSFTPGQESTCVRNENYWQDGLPYLDEVVVLDIQDESSQVNGLQSGQVDVINQLSAGSVSALQGAGYTVKINDSGNWVPFTMRTDTGPFSDVRVRQAFRLIPDRQQMLEQVFGGYGSVANDLFSPFDPDFPSDIPQRERDIDQAKSLLKSAGQANLRVKLATKPATAGEVALAEIFATQAKDAGVTVEVDQQTVTSFYSNSYLKVPFGTDYGLGLPYLANAGQLLIGDRAFFNACHFDDPEYNKTYDRAIATLDSGERKDLIRQLAEIDHDRGGYIVPVFNPTIEAYSDKVGGIEDSNTGVTPGNANFKSFFMA